MANNDFEPAKILERPDDKQREKSDPKDTTGATGAQSPPAGPPAKTEPSDPKATEGDSYEGILDRFTGKNKGHGRVGPAIRHVPKRRVQGAL